MMSSLQEVDTDLFYRINHGWANPVLDAVFPWITSLENFWPAILVLVLVMAIFGGKRGRVCLLAVALAVAIADPLTVRVLKPLFERARPCVELADVRLLYAMRTSPSLPSAHAVNMFAVATVFWWFYPRSAWVWMPFATMVALSRVYIGIHYPADITLGAILGIMIGVFVVTGLTLLGRRVSWLAVPGPGWWKRRRSGPAKRLESSHSPGPSAEI